MGTMKRTLSKIVSSCNKNWDDFIPAVVQIYRVRKEKDGLSPFQLTFGVPLCWTLSEFPFVDSVDRDPNQKDIRLV